MTKKALEDFDDDNRPVLTAAELVAVVEHIETLPHESKWGTLTHQIVGADMPLYSRLHKAHMMIGNVLGELRNYTAIVSALRERYDAERKERNAEASKRGAETRKQHIAKWTAAAKEAVKLHPTDQHAAREHFLQAVLFGHGSVMAQYAVFDKVWEQHPHTVKAA